MMSHCGVSILDLEPAEDEERRRRDVGWSHTGEPLLPPAGFIE